MNPIILTDGLSATAMETANRETSEQRKLRDAATQFESVLIASLLEKFDSLAQISGETASDAGGETMHAIGVQAFAGKLAESGGLGIARLLIEKLGSATKDAYQGTKV